LRGADTHTQRVTDTHAEGDGHTVGRSRRGGHRRTEG
jgi:hypothetical protein